MRKQIALNSGAASLHRVLESEKIAPRNRISRANYVVSHHALFPGLL